MGLRTLATLSLLLLSGIAAQAATPPFKPAAGAHNRICARYLLNRDAFESEEQIEDFCLNPMLISDFSWAFLPFAREPG